MVWVVSSGDELLEGRIVDTNAAYLASQIADRGLTCGQIQAVGDDEQSLVECWERARLAGAAGVVMTGGLGDTRDDLTRAAMAHFFKVPLMPHGEALSMMEQFYLKLGRELPEAEPTEAILPAGAVALHNPSGVAPGVVCADDGFLVLAMPGVPHELKGMVEFGALDHLPRTVESVSVGRICHVGIPERRLGGAYRDYLTRGRNPLVAIAPKRGHVELCVRATHPTAEGAAALLAQDMEALALIEPESIISLRGEAPSQRVGRELMERGLTLSVAESLTGGLIGHQLTELAGISGVLLGDCVVYSNAAKVGMLGVAQGDLDSYGAVSEAVACAMAEGIRRLTQSDLAVSTTGIAGPGGGSREKPVGLVWAAVADANGTVAERRILPGNRSEVKDRAAAFALDLLRRACSWGQGG